MSFEAYKQLILGDVRRYYGVASLGQVVKGFMSFPGYRYTFLVRTCRYLRGGGALAMPLYALARLLLNHYTYRFGICIQVMTDIGAGLYIGHFGGIVLNGAAKIGKNCNINHGVTIGEAFGGKFPGCPTIGSHVYLGPGAKVIGGITIGDHVAVGANCVVTKPVPDYAVVVGIPGEVISTKGSGAYVNNTVP